MRSPEHERQVRVVAELVAVVDRHALDTGPKPLASGDRRGGVVWYTQGSGKSLAMAFYKGDGGGGGGSFASGHEEPDAGRPHQPQRRERIED